MMHEALQMIHNKQATQKRKLSVANRKATQNGDTNFRNTRQMTQSAPQLKSTATFTSSVAVHKLRETKWFKYNECKIFLSVVENGFILERRNSANQTEQEHLWAIAMWTTGQEKSKDINHLYIYTLSKEKDKVNRLKLEEFWSIDNEMRINNQHDKEKMPNIEDDIRKQIEYALKNRTQKWHNNQHFPYFCRYDKPMPGRIQQISERVRWNSIGVSLGMLMRGRNRRPTASK